MNKKIFFLILLLFTMFFDNYAFGIVVVPTHTHGYSSNHYSNLTETMFERKREEKGEEIILKKCLKKEYLFLNNGKDYCVIKNIMSKKIYFINKIIFWSAGLSVVLLLFLLGYGLLHEEEI